MFRITQMVIQVVTTFVKLFLISADTLRICFKSVSVLVLSFEIIPILVRVQLEHHCIFFVQKEIIFVFLKERTHLEVVLCI